MIFVKGWLTVHTFVSLFLNQSSINYSTLFTWAGSRWLWNPGRGTLFSRLMGQPNQTITHHPIVSPLRADSLAVQATHLQGQKFPNGWGSAIHNYLFITSFTVHMSPSLGLYWVCGHRPYFKLPPSSSLKMDGTLLFGFYSIIMSLSMAKTSFPWPVYHKPSWPNGQNLFSH